ncbi:unknown protein [Parachlamydia acanthamoebae UV-7]|uniref:Uncharacterized protein n=1 Tax=Parachlamydia acanthamoebae (strain UV7) TaxID=765952 RepID=F8L187_PARAV|nr:unknown protein [Parachlamydia acanthamoebae UV-7]
MGTDQRFIVWARGDVGCIVKDNLESVLYRYLAGMSFRD